MVTRSVNCVFLPYRVVTTSLAQLGCFLMAFCHGTVRLGVGLVGVSFVTRVILVFPLGPFAPVFEDSINQTTQVWAQQFAQKSYLSNLLVWKDL